MNYYGNDASNYVLAKCSGSDELKHYGVLGMRWRVHRATKKLSKATTDEERRKAVASLQKHRTKATNKVAKLQKQHTKLQKSVDQYITKSDIKAAKMKQKADKLNQKAYGIFTSTKRAQKLLYKSEKLNIKADAIIARSMEAKAKIAKNERLQAMFNEGISNIDQTLVSSGYKYLNDDK